MASSYASPFTHGIKYILRGIEGGAQSTLAKETGANLESSSIEYVSTTSAIARPDRRRRLAADRPDPILVYTSSSGTPDNRAGGVMSLSQSAQEMQQTQPKVTPALMHDQCRQELATRAAKLLQHSKET